MTRKSQKEYERRIVEAYLRERRIVGEVVPDEAPDFLVHTDSRSIGIEVIEYHQPQRSEQGHTRSQVEAEWARIRAEVVRYRKAHRDLDGLSVLLGFKSLLVPNRRETEQFIEAVHREIRRVRPALGDGWTVVRIGEDQPQILRKYVRRIDLRIADAYVEWDWNHSGGWVGPTEEELLSFLASKLKLERPPGVDELHLVLFAFGSSVGTFIGLIEQERLEDWARLGEALRTSAFDQFAIRGERLLVWTRNGWRRIDERRD